MSNFMEMHLPGVVGAIAVTLSLGLGTAAEAVPLAGTFGGTIGSPTGATDPLVSSQHTSDTILRWGTTTTGGSSTSSSGSSQLQVLGGAFSDDFAMPSTGEILLGQISWRNMSNFNTGGEWNTDLNLTVNYTQPSNSGPHPNALSLHVTNTEDPNQNPGNNHGTGNDPDSISGLQFSNLSFGGTPLDLGSNLSIIGYLIKLDDEGTAGTSGFTSSYLDGLWMNREGNTSILGIYAQVEVVPLPAAAWLLIAGIGGLGLVARRRKAGEA